MISYCYASQSNSRRHSACVIIIQIILLAVSVFFVGQLEELDRTKAQRCNPHVV